ncbi:uncharacterized protein N0V89_000645 [Didymosphaeria variabile]|uniref:Uncharacterized protein n=1 Tax=Didymosphaeria variabile TaxID=1932322 RepID=A0A9W8XVP7_9PLEO|nr:uncharacterized protein N0V89_000645 [Didymosphaeria variabile]KAJ4360086.1 hypothetical protein N0V89_000645 [Didymosphaeria variabile]
MPPGSNAYASSAQHRSKRPYQPPITSFFTSYDFGHSSDSDSERGPGPNTRKRISASGAKHQHQHQQHPHQLPGSVQSDLLSVGMRVRKSVPEGYKTHKTLSLPSIQTTLTMSPNGASTTTMTTIKEYSVKPPREPVPAHVQHQRELLPFCGLQKIGGYAEQPVTNVHLYGGADASGERALNIFPLPAEAFSQPFSSQSSTSSSISNASLHAPNPANLHKRSWQDEEEAPARLSSNFLFKIPMKVSEDEVPISPLSATPSNGFPQAPMRPFAQPKARRSGLRAMDVDGIVVKEMDMDMDLENADQTEDRVVVGSPGDFDEAEFLQPWGTGREVRMSGI